MDHAGAAPLLKVQCRGAEVETGVGQTNVSERMSGPQSGLPAGLKKSMSLESLTADLGLLGSDTHIGQILQLLSQYVGATHYLLTHYDLVAEQGLDVIISSNWPFDLVRRMSLELHVVYSRTNELEKCLQVLQPAFALLPNEAILPEGVSQQFCSQIFNIGKTRLCLMLLFPENYILSQERLREVGLLAGYLSHHFNLVEARTEREFELTEREIECLYWIAEGKTSDEMAMILGISRNTINNYITSVMRKTATRTRSEAIAFAVRNNLV
jgi:DNA-binding CsgD family transcriptional regulator